MLCDMFGIDDSEPQTRAEELPHKPDVKSADGSPTMKEIADAIGVSPPRAAAIYKDALANFYRNWGAFVNIHDHERERHQVLLKYGDSDPELIATRKRQAAERRARERREREESEKRRREEWARWESVRKEREAAQREAHRDRARRLGILPEPARSMILGYDQQVAAGTMLRRFDDTIDLWTYRHVGAASAMWVQGDYRDRDFYKRINDPRHVPGP